MDAEFFGAILQLSLLFLGVLCAVVGVFWALDHWVAPLDNAGIAQRVREQKEGQR